MTELERVEPLEVLKMSMCGQHIIEASAGTGKTFNITRIFLKLLLVQGVDIENILIVTFTKAATEELKGRIAAETNQLLHRLQHNRDKVDDMFIDMIAMIKVEDEHASEQAKPNEAQFKLAINRLKLASVRLDEAAIFTIHSFCMRVIKQTAFSRQESFAAEVIQSSDKYILKAVQDWYRINQDDPTIAKTLQALNILKPESFFNAFKSALKGHKHLTVIAKDPAQAAAELQALEDEYAMSKRVLDEERDKLIAEFNPAEFERIYIDYQSSIDEFFRNEKTNDKRKAFFEIKNWLNKITDVLPAKSNIKKPFGSRTVPKYLDKDASLEIDFLVRLGGRVYDFRTDLAEEFVAFEKSPNKINEHKKAREREQNYRLIYDAITQIKSKVNEAKTKAHVIDHDDTIERLASAVRAQNVSVIDFIKRQYPYALIDEFQDTDASQYAIFSQCYPADATDSMLLMIGDPKQAIYSFRGGDLNTYLTAYKRAKQRWTMQHNYRSSQAMIDAYNSLFYGAPLHQFTSLDALKSHLPDNQQDSTLSPTPKGETPYAEASPVFGESIEYPWIYKGKKSDGESSELKDITPSSIIFQYNPDEWQEDTELCQGKDKKGSGSEAFKDDQCTYVANEISRLLTEVYIGDELVQPKDIAILVAKGSDADRVQNALNQANIASVYLSDKTNIYQSLEAKALLYVLDGTLNIQDMTLVMRALSTNLFGFSASELLAFDTDPSAFEHAIKLMIQFRQQWQEKGIFVAITELLQQRFKARTQASSIERTLTNYMHLAELLNAQSKQLDHPYQLQHWLEQQIAYAAQEDGDEGENHQRLESDEALVKIVTLHGSKGLEYPIVFIPFAGTKPYYVNDSHVCQFTSLPDDSDPNSAPQQQLQIGHSDDAKTLRDTERMAEQMRLLYVGITRAEYRCYLGIGRYENFKGSALHDLLAPQLTTEEDSPQLPIETFEACFHKLANEHSNLFNLATYETHQPAISYENKDEKPETAVSSNKANTHSQWQLASFSKLTKRLAHVDMRGRNADDDEVSSATAAETAIDIQALPYRFSMQRSAETGDLLHNILEDEEFTLDTQNQAQFINVDDDNKHVNFYRNEKRPCVVEELNTWLNEVIQTQLPNCNNPEQALVSLSQLSYGHVLKEPEFYFPLSSINTVQFNKLLDTHRQEVSASPLPAKLKYQQITGMMHGFIDLLFLHDGKYYVCDYKSNHLGNQPSDYQQASMSQAIQSHHYDLQYLIYSWALDRFLQQKLGQTYDREKHFGGVYYLFLRGMSPDYPMGHGVYHCQLSRNVWQPIEQIFAVPSSKGAA